MSKHTKTAIAAATSTSTPKAEAPIIAPSLFDGLADSALLREAALVNNPRRPSAPVPLPFSASTLWRKVKNGTFPKPIKLGEGITAWRVGDIRAWINACGMGMLPSTTPNITTSNVVQMGAK